MPPPFVWRFKFSANVTHDFSNIVNRISQNITCRMWWDDSYLPFIFAGLSIDDNRFVLDSSCIVNQYTCVNLLRYHIENFMAVITLVLFNPSRIFCTCHAANCMFIKPATHWLFHRAWHVFCYNENDAFTTLFCNALSLFMIDTKTGVVNCHDNLLKITSHPSLFIMMMKTSAYSMVQCQFLFFCWDFVW